LEVLEQFCLSLFLRYFSRAIAASGIAGVSAQHGRRLQARVLVSA
jgi:hypothetical protein